MLGKKHSEATKQKMRDNHVGMSGKPLTEEHKKKLMKENVGYSGLHRWIRKYKKKNDRCENCETKERKLEFANVSGKYLRDVDDFVSLCRICHHLIDNLGWKPGQVVNPTGRRGYGK